MPAFLAQDYTLLRAEDHLVMALKREVLVSLLLLTHHSVEYPHTYAHRNARYMGSHHLGLYQEARAGREGKVKLVGRCHGRFSGIEAGEEGWGFTDMVRGVFACKTNFMGIGQAVPEMIQGGCMH